MSGIPALATKAHPSSHGDQAEATSTGKGSLAIGVVLAVATLLALLVLVVPGGTLGRGLRGLLGYEFGWDSFLVPVVLGAWAAATLRSRFDAGYRVRLAERVGWPGVFVALATILQPIEGDPAPRWDAMAGGGWLGRLVWTALVQELGEPSSAILASLVGLVALALLLDLTVEDVLGMARHAPRLAWLGARATARASAATGCWIGDTLRSRLIASRATASALPGSDHEAMAGIPVDAPPRPVPVAEPPAIRGASGWQLPPVGLLAAATSGELGQVDLSKKVKQIEETLADFDVYAKVVQVSPGPTVTQFGLEPGFREKRDRNGTVIKREKIKVSEITALQNDLALALAAPSIRIEAPVPGRQVVGIEVPNGQTTVVSLRSVVESTAFQKLRGKTRLALALGEDVSGQPVAADLARMPHLLIAGSTGSGKSVCINAIISCLLLQATPEEVRLILVDPKRVEMTAYNDVPHLLRPVVVDVDKVVGVLKWVVHEMDQRYKLFESCGVRNVEGFNKLAASGAAPPRPGVDPALLRPLPFIVVVIDELADLMMLAPDDTERLLCRLAQLARATGIHLIVATQRPSVDVITGLIKANFPTRISFAVTSQVDSRTILDTPGAEKLLGRGDMLYLPTDAAKPARLQGVWVSEEEIEALTTHWRTFGPPSYVESLIHVPSNDEAGNEETDELYERAAELAREHTRISTSLLQRRLRVGYTRAARLVDLLEQNGVVGPAEGGGRSREVNHEERTGVTTSGM